MDITEIAARLAIQELANRYTDAILRNDLECYADCWSENASWHIMGQHLQGREQIVGFYKSLTEGTLHVRHLSHSPILRVDGDRATGRFQVTETVCHKDGAGSIILGVYDDAYAKEGDVWRFVERKLDMIYHGPFPFEAERFAPLDVTNHGF